MFEGLLEEEWKVWKQDFPLYQNISEELEFELGLKEQTGLIPVILTGIHSFYDKNNSLTLEDVLNQYLTSMEARILGYKWIYTQFKDRINELNPESLEISDDYTAIDKQYKEYISMMKDVLFDLPCSHINPTLFDRRFFLHIENKLLPINGLVQRALIEALCSSDDPFRFLTENTPPMKTILSTKNYENMCLLHIFDSMIKFDSYIEFIHYSGDYPDKNDIDRIASKMDTFIVFRPIAWKSKFVDLVVRFRSDGNQNPFDPQMEIKYEGKRKIEETNDKLFLITYRFTLRFSLDQAIQTLEFYRSDQHGSTLANRFVQEHEDVSHYLLWIVPTLPESNQILPSTSINVTQQFLLSTNENLLTQH